MLTRLRFQEQTAAQVTGTVTDRAGTPIPGSGLTSATLTLWNVEQRGSNGSPSEAIINNRDQQDVLQVNNVTISEAGLFTWLLQPEDNPIVDPRRQVERHHALFSFAWSVGSPAVNGEASTLFEIDVENLGKEG